MDSGIKFKLSDISSNNSEVSSFSLTYSGKKMQSYEVSYEIISALKKESELIIELNSSLLYIDSHNKSILPEKFLAELQSYGVEFLNKKTLNNERRRFFSIPMMEGKKVEGYEIYAFIPNDVWCDPKFKTLIPKVGLRYYVPLPETDNNLSAFASLEEEERLALCQMVIFDNAMLSSMGITSVKLTKSNISELLK